MMRKDFQVVERSNIEKSEKNNKKRRFRRSKLKKSEKMMRKDISGGGFQKFRKKDEKRRFRRSKVKVQKIRKMMKKDFQEVERSKIKNPKK